MSARNELATFWCCLIVVIGCCACSSWANEDVVEVRLHGEELVGPPLVGFGAQMNPYLYAKPNWGEVTEQNVVDLERKVIELGPQFVRVFMAHEWREGKGDGVNKGGEPRMWESFLRTLRLAQRSGARITITTWWGEPSFPERTAQRTAALLDELINREGIASIHSINMMNEPDMVWPGEENWAIPNYNRMYRELDRQLKRLGL